MSGINVCMFSGNATRDPELKIAKTGTRYVTLGVAVNNRVYDAGKQEYCNTVAFIDFIAFGDNVDYILEHVSRGTKVYIESKLEQSMYRDSKDGKIKRWSSFRIINIDIRENNRKTWTSPEWM